MGVLHTSWDKRNVNLSYHEHEEVHFSLVCPLQGSYSVHDLDTDQAYEAGVGLEANASKPKCILLHKAYGGACSHEPFGGHVVGAVLDVAF